MFGRRGDERVAERRSREGLGRLEGGCVTLVSSVGFTGTRGVGGGVSSLRERLRPRSLKRLLRSCAPRFGMRVLHGVRGLFVCSSLLRNTTLRFRSRLRSGKVSTRMIFRMGHMLGRLEDVMQVPSRRGGTSLSSGFTKVYSRTKLMIDGVVGGCLTG